METGRFSFAYMKEALSVSRYSCRCKLNHSSVSTLLTLAGRESAPKKSDFGDILIDQVNFLREELQTAREVTNVPCGGQASGAHPEGQPSFEMTDWAPMNDGGGQENLPLVTWFDAPRTQHVMQVE